MVAIAHHVTRDMIATTQDMIATITAGTTAMAPTVGVVAIAAAAVTALVAAMVGAAALAVMVRMAGPAVDGPRVRRIDVGPGAGLDDGVGAN